MAWRKWLVRGFVFSVLGAAALGALAYQHWTNPDAVRELVLGKLRTIFPGAAVLLDSARLRILGGIQVYELRLRPVHADKQELAHVPAAILYHDKEKLVEGQVALRKVVLERPRIRLVRDPGGPWNVQGVIAPSDPTKPLPTVVVHQGTVLIDDRGNSDRAISLELSDVSLTMINDPLPTVTIDGLGHSDVFGKVHVRAVWDRSRNNFTFDLKSPEVPLNDKLLKRVSALCPEGKLRDVHVDGVASAAVHGAYRPASEPAFTYGVQVRAVKTRVQHPALPLPLDELEGELFCNGSELRLEKLSARAGAARVSARAVAILPCLDENFEATVTVAGLEVDEKLSERLPGKLRPVVEAFEPRGPATLRLACARRGGAWVKLAGGAESACTLQPDNMAMRFQRFPYPLDKVHGSLAYDLASQRLNIDLAARGGGRPVTIRGHWQGDGAAADAQFEIAATDVPLEPSLVAALEPPARHYVEAFHAAGLVDVHGKLLRKPGQPTFDYTYTIRVHDARVRWDQFPLALAEVGGAIIVTPERWQFLNFKARYQDAIVTLSGKSLDGAPAGSKGIAVEIASNNVPLDAELREALRTMPALEKAWELFQPRGRFSFTAAIERRGRQPEDLDVRVDVKGLTVVPAFFQYAFHDLAGGFHFHDLRLDVHRVSAAHGQARFYVEDGGVELHPEGALFVEVPEVQVENLRLDDDFLAACPPKVREAAAALDCTDPLRLKARFVMARGGEPDSLPDIFWDAQAWLRDASITAGVPLKHVSGAIACVGRHNGRHIAGLTGNVVLERVALYNQPFRNVRSRFYILDKQPELLHLDLNAPIFGGDVTGQATLDFADQPRFDLNLTASQIDLQELGRHNLSDAQISGVAVGRLVLSGVGSDPNTLDGHGSLDIPNGKLYKLPFFLDLIKFLGLRWPDRTLFEEAHAQFAIRGRRVRISNLELFGNAVSFTGKGDVNLDGTDLNLELYPSWARIEQLLPPAVRSVPPALSKNFLTVEARGTISGNPSDLKFVKKPMPIIVDPLLHLRDRMIGSPSLEPRRGGADMVRVPELRKLP